MARGSGTPVVFSFVAGKRIRQAATATGLAVALTAATALAAPSPGGESRSLSIYNIHTKQTTTVTFKRNGRYVAEGLKQLNHAFRDWRLDIEVEMDPELFDLLWQLKSELGETGPIHLISGHRSMKTNNMLRRTRGGQAKRSLHILGQAADVFFPNVPLEKLRNAALVHQIGGVGYYPRSGQPFVHVDTGRVRHWPRIPESQLAAILKRGVPKVPTRRVEESAVAVLDAPAPRQKPLADLTNQPGPFQLASIRQAPSRPSTVEEVLAATPTTEEPQRRDWGESWLAPSRPTEPAPRLKPTLVADAAHSAGLSTSLKPTAVAGYADAQRASTDSAGRLLGGSSTPLAGMLADAERLSALSSLGAAPDDAATGDSAQKTIPIRSVAIQPSRRQVETGGDDLTAQRPVYTASLSPRAFVSSRRAAESRFRAVLFAPPHTHVFAPAPQIAGALGARDRDGLAFAGSLFASTEVGSFTPIRSADGYEPSSLHVVEAGRKRDSGLMAFARRAIAWLTGS